MPPSHVAAAAPPPSIAVGRAEKAAAGGAEKTAGAATHVLHGGQAEGSGGLLVHDGTQASLALRASKGCIEKPECEGWGSRRARDAPHNHPRSNHDLMASGSWAR